MHAGVSIQANALRLPVGMTENGSTHLLQLQGCLVKHGVLGVVLEAVGDHEVKVSL